MTLESRWRDDRGETISVMVSPMRGLPLPRPTGRVAVLAIRALDDLADGADHYRITSSVSVRDQPRVSATVVGVDELRSEVERWLAGFLGDADARDG